jgi:hypothetical protein
MVILSKYTEPRHSALSQPLWLAAHASDWGDPLNPNTVGGQTAPHGDDVCGVVMFYVGQCLNSIGIPTYKSYGASVFCSHPNQIVVNTLINMGAHERQLLDKLLW